MSIADGGVWNYGGREAVHWSRRCNVAAPFDPTLKLVVVLETNDRIQLGLAKGLLEDAGIPYFALGQITNLVNEVDGFLRKWVRLQVPVDREAEAREILQSMTAPTSVSEE